MFAQNAHRAIIRSRDEAQVLSPKISSGARRALLSGHDLSLTDSKRSSKKIEAVKQLPETKNVIDTELAKSGYYKDSVIQYICEPDGDNSTSETTGIIVTMTSWTKRINNVEKTLLTILNNTVKPEKIILNLATEEFENKEKDLPSGLLTLVRKNPIIEIHWLKHNTSVWKKIIPTLIRFKNANVICIDDDRLYPSDFIATFKAAADKYPTGPVSGANIAFYKGMKQHCGHATLDKYIFYKDGLDFITREVMDMKSSDSILTVIANKTNHKITYLGKNYLTLIPQKNNPVAGYSVGNGIRVSSVLRKADSMFDSYIKNKDAKTEETVKETIVPEDKTENAVEEKPSKNVENRVKVALCAIAKQENNYIREWVEHYKSIGFEHIFLYDNNDIDGERFDSVIGDYIHNGFVTVLDVRGETAAQTSSYTNCYNRLGKGFDWMAFFDIDEFLSLDKKYKTISDFLSNNKFSKYNCIRICWKQFTDNGLLDVYDGNYSVKRFTQTLPITNKKASAQTKPIIRIGVSNELLITSPHGALKETKIRACNSAGAMCPNSINTNFPTWEGAALNHYRFKTIGEYIKNKIQKGWPTFYGGINNKFLDVDFFFEYNKRTKEKEEYAKKVSQEVRNTKRNLYISSWVKYDRIGIIKRNWGDELNFFFLPKMLPYKTVPFRNDSIIDPMADKKATNYLMIGSVINAKYVNSNTVIWGAGIISSSKSLAGMPKPKQVCAVRGPLTRKKLLSMGIKCPEVYGDPALLLPYVYNPEPVKKYKIGFIKHWKTTTKYPVLEGDSDVKVINISKYGNWKDVINAIVSCEYIISESLHGLIAAEAYGIPNLWVDCNLKDKEDSDFKFKDFFMSIGKNDCKSFKLTQMTTKSRLLQELNKYEHINTLDLNKLIEACPVDIILKKEGYSEEDENNTEESAG